jgi:hypothetical protein
VVVTAAVLTVVGLSVVVALVSVTAAILTAVVTPVEQDPVLDPIAAAHLAVGELSSLDPPTDRLDRHAERMGGLLDGDAGVLTLVVAEVDLTLVVVTLVGVQRDHGRHYVGRPVKGPSEAPSMASSRQGGGEEMQLTDAERQALEWLRDEDERFAGVDQRVKTDLVRRGLIWTALGQVAGQTVGASYRIAKRGTEALAAAAPA